VCECAFKRAPFNQIALKFGYRNLLHEKLVIRQFGLKRVGDVHEARATALTIRRIHADRRERRKSGSLRRDTLEAISSRERNQPATTKRPLSPTQGPRLRRGRAKHIDPRYDAQSAQAESSESIEGAGRRKRGRYL